LLTFAPVYRPQDVYISELFGDWRNSMRLTTVHDISQIHHSLRTPTPRSSPARYGRAPR